MQNSSPFGSRNDDPLLQDDPLAPSDDEEEPNADRAEDEHADREGPVGARDSGLPSSGFMEGDVNSDSVFSATAPSPSPQSENGEKSAAASPESEGPSRADLLAYLLENRAAIDVLFEMLAFDRADGEEEGYRQFLSAMRDRHEVVTQQYRDALGEKLPETDLDQDATLSPGDGSPIS